MTEFEALGIVLDLATDNAIDEQTAEENNIKSEYRRQQEALEIVGDMYERMWE